MELKIKETESIGFTTERKTWTRDPEVERYIYFEESTKENPQDESALANFFRYFEVYDRNNLVGDIKLFYENEEDILKKRAQILMVIGKRNKGIGTHALNLLLEKLKPQYNSVYCHIMRSNIASLKILKRNGFQVDGIDGEKILLSKILN